VHTYTTGTSSPNKIATRRYEPEQEQGSYSSQSPHNTSASTESDKTARQLSSRIITTSSLSSARFCPPWYALGSSPVDMLPWLCMVQYIDVAIRWRWASTDSPKPRAVDQLPRHNDYQKHIELHEAKSFASRLGLRRRDAGLVGQGGDFSRKAHQTTGPCNR
jgi:hypothetical protein